MTDARKDPVWRVATNGARKRHWGVARYSGHEWAEDSRGRTRWFASREAAQRLADKLNQENI